MIFELRQYPIRTGKRDAWVKFMDEEVIPFQMSRGMCILGSFVDEANERYVWIRRFADEAERERLYAKVYESEVWREEQEPKVGGMIDREGIEVSILSATPRSFLR